MAPSQKLVLAPGAIFRGNTVDQMALPWAYCLKISFVVTNITV